MNGLSKVTRFASSTRAFNPSSFNNTTTQLYPGFKCLSQHTRSFSFLGQPQYKKQSPEYHRNSTLYAHTSRDKLLKIEKEFIPIERHQPQNISDNVARFAVWLLRKASNLVFKEKYIHYACVLETVAAVPGMVAGMLQHLKTLRRMEHNNWIKILLDEAENERMHLMTFMEISMPTKLERNLITLAQGAYWNAFLLFYLISPKTAHRFTGYLEEEAVITYTNMLHDLDAGKVENVEAPQIAREYWGLPDDAKLRDVILVIRQDEVDHGHVNHQLSNMIATGNEDPVLFESHDDPININIEKEKQHQDKLHHQQQQHKN
ncbi:alternative oxidase [Heterostelium album PN500]|uniref:Alternative oxidase n=1 Tax=Heterostelium pallidum (strain ATCC 26659 / Pp 5 / PN500) TaxID=670386 RepID=D3AXV6_HETP5|nr:alternative oxidase [Heterostelium album PN500]EFA85783.1 alternative oxidase [Heterostelium album PN500]|eukprot:XP_020437889.1 alternative oxidase [Heterostelium album PN500]